MKIVKEWHYLTRYKTGAQSEWQIMCFRCLMRYQGAVNNLVVISYSDLDCKGCGVVHVTPPGIRPPFKMREVMYVIKASYPDYDLTA